jgi:PAS domain S-box-containing protein
LNNSIPLDNKPTSWQLLRIKQLEDEHAFGLVGTYYLDYGLKIVYADRALSAMYGLEFNEAGIPLDHFLKNIFDEDLKKANHLRDHQIHNNQPYQMEYRVQHAGDKVTWVLVRAQVKRIAEEIFYEGIVVDISSQKEAEKAVQAQNKLIQTITDNATSAMFLMNEHGYCTFINPAGEAMFGYSREEIGSKPLHYLIHHHYPNGEPYFKEDCPLDRALPQNSEMRAHEELFFRKDGTSIPVLCAASPIFENGVPVATVIEVRDITEQKKSEELLKRNAERLQLLYSFSASVSESLNMQEILQKVTDAIAQLTGADIGASFYQTAGSFEEPQLIYTHVGAAKEAFDQFAASGNTSILYSTSDGAAVVRVSDVTKDLTFSKNETIIRMLELQMPVISYMTVPLMSKTGRVIGRLFLGNKNADYFSLEHQKLAVSIAAQAAIAMDNAELFEEIKVLNTKKDEFLSIASHELKTPLTSIKAFNQLMRRTQETEKLAGYIDKSAAHIVKLEKLVNDLLDVTKINAGKMQYNMQLFDFRQMLLESIESVQHTVNSHEIVLNANVDLEFKGDQLRMEQVVNNFLINAVKYSPGGKKVVVNATIEEGNIIVSVQDFGVGIPKDHLDHLFERFYRVDNTAMRFEGLGLGLFIASEILRRHKGAFWIESEPDKGSTFYFRLPIDQDADQKAVFDADTFYQDSTILIRYQKAYKCLDVDWRGFQDLKTIQAGCKKIVEMLEKHHCTKALNDNTYVLGTWSEAVEWVAQKAFPMFEQAGLTHLAWINSGPTFSRMAAKKTIDVMEGQVHTEFFANVSDARAWLDLN